MASELYNTIDALSKEKGIDPQIVVSAVEDAIVVATRKYYKTQENLRAELDKETGKIRAFAVKTVVEAPEQVEDPSLQVTLDDARKLDPNKTYVVHCAHGVRSAKAAEDIVKDSRQRHPTSVVEEHLPFPYVGTTQRWTEPR